MKRALLPITVVTILSIFIYSCSSDDDDSAPPSVIQTPTDEPDLNGQSESKMVDYFSDKGYGNAVKTLQHPAGEHYNGITYVAYQGPLEDPFVAAYIHATNKWIGPFKAGESVLGKNPDEEIDNHGKPAMIIDG